MDYMRTLGTLEGFSNAVARHCSDQIGAWAIFHPWVKVRESRELLMVVNKAPSSL